MTDRERLEVELEAVDMVIGFLEVSLIKYNVHREQLTMKLNQARRLEREELQNAEPKS